MPIEIRGRIPFTGKHPLSDTAAGRYASFFIQPPTPATADPSVIVRAAREQEALGYDSSLIPQNSARPDVWACCGWALAATQRLKLVAAHRIGWQQPTLAARTLATLDRLSNGRQYVHILQGRTDEDMQRDGDYLDKAERYARSHEYLELFKRALTEPEPFSYEGRFYKVRDAFSSIKPVQAPYPRLHFPGASAAGLELAARHADAWAVANHSLAGVGTDISRMRTLARTGHQREIKHFWAGGFNIILGETEQQAWDKAEAITREVERFIADGKAAARHALSRDEQQADQEERALYWKLSKLTGHGPSLVGSPESLAETILDYYRAGITTITLGGIVEYHSYEGSDLITGQDRGLLQALIQKTRQRIAEYDNSLSGTCANSN